MDIDTPVQYHRAVGLWQRHGIPVPGEARILLDRVCGKNSEIAVHSRTVAGITEKLAGAVNAATGTPVDTDLVVSGALLHDIAKGQPDHAAAGASQLRSWGFAEALANIVACHADCDPDGRQAVMRRWQQAKTVCRRVEQVVGCPVDAFL
ncbi:MAG: HD domain-containing protein [Desulfobacterales bacterium]